MKDGACSSCWACLSASSRFEGQRVDLWRKSRRWHANITASTKCVCVIAASTLTPIRARSAVGRAATSVVLVCAASISANWPSKVKFPVWSSLAGKRPERSMLSDPIADMLTRMRNAILVGHATVAVPHSKVKLAVAKILVEEGYIEGVSMFDDEQGHPVMEIKLKYWGKRRERRPVITELEAREQAWSSCLRGEAGHSLGIERAGNCHPDHAQGRDDRPEGAPRRRWWRGALLRLVRRCEPERRYTPGRGPGASKMTGRED